MPESAAADSSAAARWVSVRARPSADAPDVRQAVLNAFFAAGAQGVHEDGDLYVSHFPPDADLDVVRNALIAADANVSVETAPVPDVDWSEAWKARLSAHDVGALTIAPPWLAEGLDPARTVIIEPGMAFGTGDHATTRGVMRLLPRFLRAGDVVADLGAGSAVLAIGAIKLGALRAWAIEFDHDAIADAEENVERNGVKDRVQVLEGDANALLPLVAPVNVILANIISSALTELLPGMATAMLPGGTAILSGILQEEAPFMRPLLDAEGWRIVAEDAEDVWWSVAITRD